MLGVRGGGGCGGVLMFAIVGELWGLEVCGGVQVANCVWGKDLKGGGGVLVVSCGVEVGKGGRGEGKCGEEGLWY